MKYTLTLIPMENTAKAAKSWVFGVAKLRFIIALALLLPLLLIGLVLFGVGPWLYGANLQDARAQASQAAQEVQKVRAEIDMVRDSKINNSVEAALNNAVQEENAELRAKLTMADNARQAALEKSADLEVQLVTLKDKVQVYKSLIEPELSQDVFQCYKMKVNEVDNGIKYAFTLAKTDPKSKSETDVRATFRLLTGTNLEDLDREKALQTEPLASRVVTFKKEYYLSGTLKTQLPDDGVKWLDISLSRRGQQLGHCWYAL